MGLLVNYYLSRKTKYPHTHDETETETYKYP